MIENNPLVSVIIPTYNRAHLVKRAIDSVLKQTYKNFEIIVVDDASSDNTEQIINLFADRRIIYIKQEKNMGVAAARNAGIKKARGKYIAFLDSDDEFCAGKIESVLEKFSVLKDNTTLIFTNGWKDNGKKRNIVLPAERVSGYIANVKYEFPLRKTIGTTSSWVVKKSAYRGEIIFDERMRHWDDGDFYVRTAQDNKIYYYNKPLVIWHETEEHVNILKLRLVLDREIFLKNNFELMKNDRYYLKRFFFTQYKDYIRLDERKRAMDCIFRALKVFPFSINCYRKLLKLISAKAIYLKYKHKLSKKTLKTFAILCSKLFRFSNRNNNNFFNPRSKVLVVKIETLGDIIMSIPFFECLKSAYPECNISIITTLSGEELFRNNPYISKIYVFEKHWVLRKPSFSEYINKIMTLRREKFDYGINLKASADFKNDLFMTLSGVALVISVPGKFARDLISIPVDKKAKHSVDIFFNILRVLGIRNFSFPKGKIYFLPDEEKRITNKMDLVLPESNRKTVFVHFQSRNKNREWSIERNVKVLSLLNKKVPTVRIVIIGAGDVVLSKKIIKTLPFTIIDLTNKTSLRELYLLFKLYCDVLFSTDSGPAHLAACCDVPTVLLSGHTPMSRPLNKKLKIIETNTDEITGEAKIDNIKHEYAVNQILEFLDNRCE